MIDITLCHPEILLDFLIDIIGDLVEGKETKVRRIAAREVARLDDKFRYANNGRDVLMAVLEFCELKCRLADPDTYFYEELLNEPEPYSAEGILFSTLVHLVRIEENMFFWKWPPEQMRALGLSMNPGDELAWPITREFVTIKDRDGTPRPFYGLS